MNLIAPLLTPATTLLDVSFSSKKKLFEHAAELFAQTHGLKASDIFSSLFERERLGSTALGYGIAIPHGRIKGLQDAAGAFYRLSTPLEFDAPDNQPVSLCFVLLVPKDANEAHLQILGELAQLFGDEGMRARMFEAASPSDLIALVAAWSG
ncbi:Possible PTS IIA-like nitrogen-regulatory protein PtsN [Thiobacillus denitrificans ATCC 25259]|uniref:Possible PTS IIA-like nitrogen-regulatory protein PtsN n=1 Tax=Thiobacillus denitrificans (strain ATCC 25259 / T1) TaxID=292415 RepID=Q3SLD1_THIDA|nr:PTS sugar transporter subunit IIA [Thiobacillus denitrificans]AAZ96484.1 Possible PTS IIA-like nitrogen-regulatory protein PtsN [Thiobacillus denitrificans ATCC 25259]